MRRPVLSVTWSQTPNIGVLVAWLKYTRLTWLGDPQLPEPWRFWTKHHCHQPVTPYYPVDPGLCHHPAWLDHWPVLPRRLFGHCFHGSVGQVLRKLLAVLGGHHHHQMIQSLFENKKVNCLNRWSDAITAEVLPLSNNNKKKTWASSPENLSLGFATK